MRIALLKKMVLGSFTVALPYVRLQSSIRTFSIIAYNLLKFFPIKKRKLKNVSRAPMKNPLRYIYITLLFLIKNILFLGFLLFSFLKVVKKH